ncbi:serine/threonine-protein phosphatase 6 regulatory ankyrin repeat subunit B-like [Herrania umbratica]|uniref:Serine/threonine-protein phosphatase 6 regulatory ankyrin repeat subunit B-like n=1 Tax=Herrania umbratica TaxID=108875 RepID=A0A6J1B7P9_9ROSI|nr:serine/threonine-protein phosphatase 6 regulatory ankyrin repeat subunit B-like [Herrania umbratica]
MENLLEISEPEVRINFVLNSKCRCNLVLRSLCPAFPVAFKVQTSAPHKFLVNPPSGLVPPLSHVALQIVLKPQDQIPPTFPRSHSDRFLIRTALFDLDSGMTAHSDSVNSWLSARATHDIKLKVAFVGPFLLHHAVSCGDFEVVKNMIKRQKSVLYDLSTREAESLLRVATQLANSEDMVNLLLEAGLRTASREEEEDGNDAGFYQLDPRWESKGWTELHVAVVFDQTEELVELLRKGRREPLDWRDKEGRTPLHLAASKGNIECAKILVESGVDKNAKSKDGRTALFRAAANGSRRMVEMLIEMDADPTIPDDRGRSAFDIARDKGHEEMVEIMERGEEVLMVARRGDARRLQSLLQNGAATNFQDQYGLTALHAAAIKGHRDVVSVLIESGSDLERGDNEGHTALHLAVEGGHLETVEALIEKGANAKAKNTRGVSPLYMAKTMGYDVISQVLMQRGNCSSLPSASSSSSSLPSML